ncbi:glycosyltransferase [Thiothrix unzii]|jgi:glycosyltransferase involved in cell wall biosynthesis|uniref:glycosyltransferase n=1 Tax=Thiothrix unzii TaxID=111769 RepID=UPI002A371C54|nr:glycosyltransferase [Thiothrix unzii]MDX9988231.1 glycosyltransferase [Thiothrix unzii]
MLYINSYNIHQGGGKTLLLNLLMCKIIGDIPHLFLLDSRLESNLAKHFLKTRIISPSIFCRLKAEWQLFRLVKKNDKLLCFGNLPPLFPSCGHVSVFLQNRYLLRTSTLSGLTFKEKLRITIERIWLKKCAQHVDHFIVQTPTMKSLLKKTIGNNHKILIAPFMPSSKLPIKKANKSEKIQYDFIYVASGESHKNHRNLIEAFCLLADDNIYPSLCLTLDKKIFLELHTWIENKKIEHHLKIENIGLISHQEVLQKYECTRALIYPSFFESFGIPLLEAQQQGISILAAELDYVRDILNPDESFDPQSPVSIARSIKRFLRIQENELKIFDPEDFIKKIESLTAKS